MFRFCGAVTFEVAPLFRVFHLLFFFLFFDFPVAKTSRSLFFSPKQQLEQSPQKFRRFDANDLHSLLLSLFKTDPFSFRQKPFSSTKTFFTSAPSGWRTVRFFQNRTAGNAFCALLFPTEDSLSSFYFMPANTPPMTHSAHPIMASRQGSGQVTRTSTTPDAIQAAPMPFPQPQPLLFRLSRLMFFPPSSPAIGDDARLPRVSMSPAVSYSPDCPCGSARQRFSFLQRKNAAEAACCRFRSAFLFCGNFGNPFRLPPAKFFQTGRSRGIFQKDQTYSTVNTIVEESGDAAPSVVTERTDSSNVPVSSGV